MHGPVEVGTRKDNTEFVASATEHEVRATHCALDGLGDLREHLVADHVTVGVIHQLEAVDVDHQQGERCRVAVGTGCFARKQLVKKSGVIKTGQRIGDRCSLEFGEQARIFQRDRREVRHG